MKTLCLLGTAALLLAASAASAADKPAADNHGGSCFMSRDWGNWSTSADGDAIYLRISANQIYRVDLAPGSHVRRGVDDFLVNRMRGSDWVCSAQDLDLTLSDHEGFRQPLFPRALHKLTSDEVSALPKKELP